MKNSDRSSFIEMLSASLDIYARKLSQGAYTIWFEALKGFEIEDIRGAFQEYVLAGKEQAPVPATIIKILQANDGWIGVEEAWAIVSKTLQDERQTIFWTHPMQVAYGTAAELADDPIAARMAFKEVYERELKAARLSGGRPVWQMSPGSDKDMREAAVLEAARLGRIEQAHAAGLLPYHREAQLSQATDLANLKAALR